MHLHCNALCDDILFTAECLRALGAAITYEDKTFTVEHIPTEPQRRKAPAEFHVGESGSTLRFMLGLAAALGREGYFYMQGRLPGRPLSPFDEVLEAHGIRLFNKGSSPLHLTGTLTPGRYEIRGDVSSQFITSLLLALPLLAGDSELCVTGRLQSRPYVDITLEMMQTFGLCVREEANTFFIPGGQRPNSPGELTVEGDYSSAAAAAAVGALSPHGVLLRGLRPNSPQGDKAMLDILRRVGAKVEFRNEGLFVQKNELRPVEVDAGDIPDLVPVLTALLAGVPGESRIFGAERVRLKESDRLRTTTAALCALGADIEELPGGLIIRGKEALRGGTASAYNDHRIAMCLAVGAALCTEAVCITGSECINKSYPNFFSDFAALGAKVEQKQ